MSSGAFERNSHRTAEDFKKCLRQPERKRKQDPGISELGKTINYSIATFIQSVNKHLVKAYYVPCPMLSTGGHNDE